jgi:hypothetical protein
MEPLGDVGQVEGCFSPLGDGVNHGATKVHGLGERAQALKIFLDTLDGTPR